MRRMAVSVFMAGFLAVFLFCCSKDDSQRDETGEQLGEEKQAEKYGDETVVIQVDGKAVTRGQIARELDMLQGQLRGRASPQQIEAMRDTLEKQAVDKAINRRLLEEVIERDGIEASKEEVDAKIAEIKGNFGSEELFADQLANAGMTEEEFENEVEVGLNVEKIFERETANIKDVTESDIESYYSNNTGRFQQPEQIKASHILVKVDENDGEAVGTEKKEQALDLLRQVEEGANFAQLAALHSDCPSKSRGGDLGYFGRGQMVKPFEEAAFALKVGEISGLVETAFGYHIIKVTDHKDARTTPLEEVRDKIKNIVEVENRQRVILDYIDALRGAAVIEYID